VSNSAGGADLTEVCSILPASRPMDDSRRLSQFRIPRVAWRVSAGIDDIRSGHRLSNRHEDSAMLRSFFLAVGISALLLGVECLVIERAELHGEDSTTLAGFARRAAPSYQEVEPPEWAPWSLMSVGAVVILYTITIPKRAA
jgi:hypothetical protein